MTTWWDVYETLLHLLLDQDQIINNLDNNNNSSSINYDIENEKLENYFLENSNYFQDRIKNRNKLNKPNGYSLFSPIPNRNCKTANIPSYLCSCDISVDIDTKNEIVKQGALFLVSHINDYLLKDYRSICMNLTLNKIIDAQIYQNKNKYSVIFQTSPNKAVFDASFTFKNKTTSSYSYTRSFKNSTLALTSNSTLAQYDFQVFGQIIRINEYGQTSKCMKIYSLKNFCYCNNKL